MQATESSAETIGACSECRQPWGAHNGGRVCCVCRKLVLVCDDCDAATAHGEYWCSDHAELRDLYFHFVDRFSVSELDEQLRQLRVLLSNEQGPSKKNRRNTLRKKTDQIEVRLGELRALG